MPDNQPIDLLDQAVRAIALLYRDVGAALPPPIVVEWEPAAPAPLHAPATWDV